MAIYSLRRNPRTRPPHGQRGVSLIEVMVALVVLTTGILALALLQVKVTRGAAEAKVRSFAMGYAQTELERLRASTINVTNYQNLVDIPAAPIVGSEEATGMLFQRELVVNRFVRSTGTGCTPTTAPCFLPAADNATTSVDTPDYKQLALTISWTSADSQATFDKNVVVNDVLSVLSLSGSTSLITSTGSSGSGGPIVIQTKASADMSGVGVIPIATGGANGEATAASNPKPLVNSNTGTSSTSFNVLTYFDPNTGNIQIQREVDTRVVACKCKHTALTGTSFFTTKFRPTYWNGTFYSTPKTLDQDGYALTDTPNASAAATESYTNALGNTVTRTIVQDELCDDCCRDHHDPSTAGTKPKFDPYMADAHTHYHFSLNTDGSANTSSPSVADASTPTSIYSEACRMIRVNGIWHTAVDLNQEHMSLLATNQTPVVSPVAAPAYAPTTTATGHYVNFVKDYLALRVINAGVSPIDSTGDDVTSGELTTLETTNVINAPNLIAMPTAINSKKYLHDRGLYLDWLSPEAKSLLDQQLAQCTEPAATRINCILPYLPFVTINTTELASWTASTPLSAPQSVSEPKRGTINVASAGTVGATATGSVAMQRSNTGVVFAVPIDRWDGLTVPSASPTSYSGRTTTDTQNFEFSNSGLTDTDGDTVADADDNCPANANPLQENQDGDALGDICDPDKDGDGADNGSDNCPVIVNADQADGDSDIVGDLCDNCPVDANGDQADGDGDLIGNVCDPDLDNDGVPNGSDNCPVNANADQADADADGIGNVCDAVSPPLDGDGDGILDGSDNCPTVSNASQLDSDGDGIGDACDPTPLPPYAFTVRVALGNPVENAARPTVVRKEGTPVPSTYSCGNWSATPSKYTFACTGASYSDQTIVITNFDFARAVTTPNSDKTFNPCNWTVGGNEVKRVNCGIFAASPATVIVQRTRAAVTTTLVVTPVLTGSMTGTAKDSAINFASSPTVPADTHTYTIPLTGVQAGDLYIINLGTAVETNILTPVSANHNTTDRCAGSGGKCSCDVATGTPVYDFSKCN